MESLFNKLLSFSNEKKNNLEEILRISKEQTEVIKDENVDGLNELIDIKQKFIDKINFLDDQFNKTFEELKKIAGNIDMKDIDGRKFSKAKELQECIVSITEIIAQIMEFEKINSNFSKELHTELKNKLTQIRNSKKANAGYASKAKPPSVYFDKLK